MSGATKPMFLGPLKFFSSSSPVLIQVLLLFALSFICAALPFRKPPHIARFDGGRENFPGWKAAPILLSDLKNIPLDRKTQQFATEFPGKIGVFSDGRKTWIVRWVVEPTRKLHPSSDCLRAAGYKVKPDRALVDARGDLWSTCLAAREGIEINVSERIVGSRGGEWTDVSSWFWQTTWDRSTGPWWAITMLDPAVGRSNP